MIHVKLILEPSTLTRFKFCILKRDDHIYYVKACHGLNCAKRVNVKDEQRKAAYFVFILSCFMLGCISRCFLNREVCFYCFLLLPAQEKIVTLQLLTFYWGNLRFVFIWFKTFTWISIYWPPLLLPLQMNAILFSSVLFAFFHIMSSMQSSTIKC